MNQPQGGQLVLMTVNHPNPGIIVPLPINRTYGINPGLLDSDVLTSLTVVVTSEHLDVNPVTVYVDGVSNGTLTHGGGDVWTYVPGAPVVFALGRHSITATFLDTVGGGTTLTLSFFTVSANQAKGPFKKLSQTLGQMRKGYAYDSTYGGTPISEVILAPELGTTDFVHSAITLPTTGTTVVTTNITNPDVARNLTITGNAAGIVAPVTVLGLDTNSRLVTETIIGDGTNTVEGKVAFTQIKSITVGARTTAGDTIEIGTGDALGLSRPFTAVADVKLVIVDDVSEAPASADTEGMTVTTTTPPDGSANFVIMYNAMLI